jgi:broad specificity phosphatase PhoE
MNLTYAARAQAEVVMRPALPRALLIVILLIAAAIGARPAAAQRAIYLVRHAEKLDESRDPSLSAAGQARAQRLAELLGRAGITAIYTSEYKRTAETARPLATARKLTPQGIAAKDRPALITRLRARPDEVVLVVGHSDTLPALLKELGIAAPPAVEDYGDLFVVVPSASGPPTLLHLRLP